MTDNSTWINSTLKSAIIDRVRGLGGPTEENCFGGSVCFKRGLDGNSRKYWSGGTLVYGLDRFVSLKGSTEVLRSRKLNTNNIILLGI